VKAEDRTAVVICAAGKSSRMGGIKKEYQKLDGSNLTVLGSSVRTFASVQSIGIIVIAVPADEEDAARESLPQECLPAFGQKILFVTGGPSRRASVFNALSFLEAYNPCYVLIHDGARPWVSPSLVEKIVEEVKKHDAVIPLIALTETPKECNAPLSQERAVFIESHLKRANTGTAQTPQAFAFLRILRAHEKAASLEGEEFTDDAEIWGKFCGPVAAIPGEPENRKITFPQDIF
jgi:2-C-methyl-D-erythritol 4-phosphate cytidylyltransferase/2-C-methyl-D-erythritol 4-phosphate cytidylyltransferase/2-C-methyl-D-erythritol 2,4-cyclodiphosphate synthase